MQNKQIQTSSDLKDETCQVEGVLAKASKIILKNIDITTAQGNANDAGCQTSLSKHHSTQIIQVIPISTVSIFVLITMLSYYVQSMLPHLFFQ